MIFLKSFYDMKKILLLLFVGSFIAFSCKNNKENQTEQGEQDDQFIVEQAADSTETAETEAPPPPPPPSDLTSYEGKNQAIVRSNAVSESQGYAELALNNGKKWKADAPTNQRVQKIKEMISEFEKSNAKNYHKLCTDIEPQIGALLAECKMTGEEYTALHKWLAPILAETRDLQAGDDQVVQRAYATISKQVKIYSDFFN